MPTRCARGGGGKEEKGKKGTSFFSGEEGRLLTIYTERRGKVAEVLLNSYAR